MVVLSNDELTVQVAEHGAELSSIVAKETGKEYLWQADPAFWAVSGTRRIGRKERRSHSRSMDLRGIGTLCWCNKGRMRFVFGWRVMRIP